LTGKIDLIYKRLPNCINHFEQKLVYKDRSVIVTTQQITPSEPIVIEGITVLGPNFWAIWFIFAKQWYDLGKIYNPQGKFTGYYCDIIKPMKRSGTQIEITDLFLDLWVTPDLGYQILDHDEFASAIQNGWIEPDLASQAQQALDQLISVVESTNFPPEPVKLFDLDCIVENTGLAQPDM